MPDNSSNECEEQGSIHCPDWGCGRENPESGPRAAQVSWEHETPRKEQKLGGTRVSKRCSVMLPSGPWAPEAASLLGDPYMRWEEEVSPFLGTPEALAGKSPQS